MQIGITIYLNGIDLKLKWNKSLQSFYCSILDELSEPRHCKTITFFLRSDLKINIIVK